MATIQERLQRKREPLDKWSIREQLCLASAVVRSGDQNWMSVSRALKPFGEPNRPLDWFHQKNCAAQYGALLENVETPKRKKRCSESVETPSEIILSKLKAERKAELKKLMEEEKTEYQKLQEDMTVLKSGNVTEEQLDIWCKEIDEEEQQKEKETQAHAQWLKEREIRKLEIEKAWRPTVKINSTPTQVSGQKRKASESVDTQEEASESPTVTTPTPEPSKPGLSPLLTSLLKSPSHAQNVVTSSILHSAITRPVSSNASPTIASLLNSSASVQVSPGIQQLVSTAIAQEPQQNQQSPIKNSIADLLDSSDPLPNLKVEDIESTILSGVEQLPEIKNEEVDVIISDLIENAEILTDPENQLLDGNDDIITDFENELEELVNKEKAVAEAAAAEAAKLEASKAQQHQQQLHQQGDQVKQQHLQQQLETQAIQEQPQQQDTPQPAIEDAQASGGIQDKPKQEPQIDPFEFQEDPVEYKPPKLSTGLNKQSQNQSPPPAQVPEDADDSTTISSKVIEESSPVKTEIVEETKTIDKAKIEKIASDPEIVEIVQMEDEELNKNVKKDEDVTSEKSEEKSEEAPSEEVKEPLPEVKEEPEEIKSEKEETRSESTSELLDIDLKHEEETKELIEEETSRRNTFTPEYAEDFDELNIEVTKIDKPGRIKRDYSRNKKKEEQDFDILIPVEEDVKANIEEENESLSEKEDEKKFEPLNNIKPKIKLDNDRSNSPWTEEEESNGIRTRRRYSTPATPVDSVPNSPASSSAYFEDDRDYRNWKKSIMLQYSRLTTHKYASLFLKPITNEQAPGYHNIVHRPMDLQTLRKNIESGVIRTTAEFQRDVLLMFNNAIMYNKTNDTVYRMAQEMQQEGVEHIKILLAAQSQNDVPARRETRTSEGPGVKRKRGVEELVKNKKRKDD